MDIILDKIAHWVAKTPDKIAITDWDEAISYQSMEARASTLARTLIGFGAQPGDIIGYLGANGAPFVISFLACLKAGLGFMPISPKFAEKNIAHIFEIAETKICITDMPLQKTCPEVRFLGLSETQKTGKPFFQADIAGDVIAGVGCTSGSTGIPKIIPQNRNALYEFSNAQVGSYHLNATSVYGHAGTLWFTPTLCPLFLGATLACFDATTGGVQELYDWLKRQKVTAWSTYPALYRTLANVTGKLPDLDVVALCGEPVFRRDLKLFNALTHPGAIFVNAYAQQEFKWTSTFEIPHGETCKFDLIPCGTVMPYVDVSIQNEDGSRAAAEAIGEIMYRSKFLPQGYLGNPERTAQVFTELGDGTRKFATGDLGFFDIDGNLHCIGRKDEQVKIRGFNVLPSDIERELKPHPQIEAVAVVVRPCSRNLPRLACFYEGGITPKALKAWLETRVPAFMVPQFFIALDRLPRTTTGKLQRNLLTLPKDIVGTDLVAFEGADEQAIAGVWRRFLDHESFGATDNFFDVGGDSLRAMEMLFALQAHFPRHLRLEDFVLQGATIRAVAKLVSPENQPELFKVLRPGTGGPHLLATHVFDGSLGNYLELAKSIDSSIKMSGVAADYSHQSNAVSLAQKAHDAIAQIPNGDAPILMGLSYGGVLAFEMAQQMANQNPLILFDPYPIFGNRQLQKMRYLAKGWGLNVLGRETPQSDPRLHSASYAYQPKPLVTKAALIVFCDETDPQQAAGWRSVLHGPTEVITIPGSHADILLKANVKELADRIFDWLSHIPK